MTFLPTIRTLPGKSYGILALALILLLCMQAKGQVTTSGISGRVTDTNSQPVPFATVIAIHEESGTRYGTVTNTEGYYSIRGLRTGGPYLIEVGYLGMESDRRGGIVLSLGDTYRHDVELKTASVMIGEVVVVGKSGSTRLGASSTVTEAQIERMPSITHGIADAIRLNPYVRVANDGAIYFTGRNNRYNSFRIDGVTNNDVYGLAASGSNGGQAGTQPVSMETIEQIRIDVAPFDVRQSGFTGGAIDAITKKGTNRLHGAVYGYGNDQRLVGKRYRLRNGSDSKESTDRYEYRAGITLGGPLLRNKLFFFANYERADRTLRNPYSIGSPASHIDAARADAILKRLQELAAEQGIAYSGTLDAAEAYTLSDKAGLRLDWNINGNHNASFRWSMVDAKQLNSVSNAYYLNASDFSYDFVSRTNSFVLELQSRLPHSAENELRVSYVRVRDKRSPGAPFPMIQVSNVGDGTLHLGNDRSSMANSLDQDIWTLTDNVTWLFGRHTFLLGTHNEFYRFSNLFIQDAYGSYFYGSPDDFFAGRIKQYRFAQANTRVTGDPRWAAAFDAAALGFYLQDNWSVSRNLRLAYGLRLDVPVFFDTPAENAPFNAFMASKGWKYRTNTRLKSTWMLSPRFGFRWNPTGTDGCVVRGGAGFFTGRIPFVWISNNFSGTGVQLSSYMAADHQAAKDLSLILDPAQQMRNAVLLSPTSSQSVSVSDDRFVFPQDLRTNLAVDFLAGGIRWTAEAVYAKTLHDISYRNLAVEPSGKSLSETQPGLDFDHRPMMRKTEGAENYTGIYLLENSSRGYTCNVSVTAEKRFDFGLDAMVSYSFLRSLTQNNGTSSVAASSWQYNYTYGNSNEARLAYSSFHVPHSIRAALFYTKQWNGHHTTTFGLVYNGSSGITYSVCYNGDLNGDGGYNDLIFIPTDEQVDRMHFTPTAEYSEQQQKTNFKAWLGSDPYMRSHRGRYYERNADNEPFEHHFDFHFSHRFGFRIGKGIRALEVSFDLINAGNLFSKHWGRSSASNGYYNPVTYRGDGQFQFLHDADYKLHAYDDYYSRWRGQAGIKLIF